MLVVSRDHKTFHMTPGEFAPAFCGLVQPTMFGRAHSWGMAPFCGVIYPNEIAQYANCFECLVKYKASCT